MILSDDVNGDDSIDDGTECDGDNGERREGDWESAAGDDHCCSRVDGTGSCVHWTGQDTGGYGRKFYTHSTQMAEYSDKSTWGYWPSKVKHYVLPSMYLITDANLDNIIHRTNQCIVII
jgi:hypothetical protein